MFPFVSVNFSLSCLAGLATSRLATNPSTLFPVRLALIRSVELLRTPSFVAKIPLTLLRFIGVVVSRKKTVIKWESNSLEVFGWKLIRGVKQGKYALRGRPQNLGRIGFPNLYEFSEKLQMAFDPSDSRFGKLCCAWEIRVQILKTECGKWVMCVDTSQSSVIQF